MSKSDKDWATQDIDLVELARMLWAEKRLVIKVGIISIILGVLVSLALKEEYEASCKILPESNEKASNLGSLGNLAGLAGVSLNVGGDDFNVNLYPEIISSTKFINDLLEVPIYFLSLDTAMDIKTYFNYYQTPGFFSVVKDYTLGLPKKVVALFLKQEVSEMGLFPPKIDTFGIISLDKSHLAVIEELRTRIETSYDKKLGLLVINVRMPDSYACAEISALVVKFLVNELERKLNAKSKSNLDFISKRYEEAKTDYYVRQEAMASFLDKNINMSSNRAQVEYSRLEDELRLSYDLYRELALELDRAEFKVQEKRMLLQTIEPPTVPVGRSSPNRKVIVFMFFFSGIFGVITWIILRNLFSTSIN